MFTMLIILILHAVLKSHVQYLENYGSARNSKVCVSMTHLLPLHIQVEFNLLRRFLGLFLSKVERVLLF